MNISDVFVLFGVALLLMAAPFGWIIRQDLKNNPKQELEV